MPRGKEKPVEMRVTIGKEARRKHLIVKKAKGEKKQQLFFVPHPYMWDLWGREMKGRPSRTRI